MPTIDALAPAVAAADDDLLPVSQGGRVLRATRAQLVAGLQPALNLPAGVLMGRTTAGLGAPERIGVGAGLTLANGVLAAPPPFQVGGLPGGAPPQTMDLVPLSQAGHDAAIPYATLMAGLGSLSGIDLSGHRVQVPGGAARALSDWMADAVAPESFGARGDGVADDTDALDRALATGRPVRLAPRVYAVRGGWSILHAAVLLGSAGSTLRRIATPGVPAGGAFINILGPSFAATGVTFDAAAPAGDSWGVLVAPACTDTLFQHCTFRNAAGATLGSGLVVQARDGLTGSPSRHRILGCEARDNQVHGIWVQAAAGALIQGCLAHGNGAYGICLDFNDPGFAQQIRHGQILGCAAWGNQRGIQVGNFNETNQEPPRWGLANPDAVDVLVAGNACHDNWAYGIAVSGCGLQVVGNQAAGNGSGILVNAELSRVCGNVVSAPGYFGIDAGGSASCDISDNLVQGMQAGINPGGSRNLRVAGNQLLGNTWAITAYNVETDGHGANFGIAASGLVIEANRIVLRDGTGGGVFLVDAPQGVQVSRNSFFSAPGSSPSQALWAHTDALLMGGNTWDNQASIIVNPSDLGAVQQLQVPDLLDGVMVTAAPQGITGMVGQHQAAMAAQLAFIRVTQGGTGYTAASVAIGGAGTGAQAVAHVRDGAVVGIALTQAGSGYGSGPVPVTITGDGQGATAAATVGLPVPQGRQLRLHCNGPVRFKRAGSLPFQDNWTLGDMLVPAGTAVDWEGTWGGWQALGCIAGDFLQPPGDGSLTLRTTGGDLLLHPAGTGRLHVASDTEPLGYLSTLGRGSPEGVVAAAPGSDYRNLDGGAGATLWLKRSGTGPTGWAAIG